MTWSANNEIRMKLVFNHQDLQSFSHKIYPILLADQITDFHILSLKVNK